eukprot:Nk52_evm6s2587 gene=Nk52_evmTU6s2587
MVSWKTFPRVIFVVLFLCTLLALSSVGSGSPVVVSNSPSSRPKDLKMLRELKEIRTKCHGQVEGNGSVSPQPTHGEANGSKQSISDVFDAVIFYSLSGINDALEKKYQRDIASGHDSMVQVDSVAMDGSDHTLSGEFILGPPSLMFGLEKDELHVLFDVSNETKLIERDSKGDFVKEHALNSEGAIASTSCKLKQVSGKVEESPVYLDFDSMDWVVDIKYDSAKDVPANIQEAFGTLLNKAMAKSYGETLVLGSMILPPESALVAKGLTPNSFALKTIPTMDNSGRGFLVVGVGCNDNVVDASGFDSLNISKDTVFPDNRNVLFITNKNFFTTLLNEIMGLGDSWATEQDPHTGLYHPINGTYYYGDIKEELAVKEGKKKSGKMAFCDVTKWGMLKVFGKNISSPYTQDETSRFENIPVNFGRTQFKYKKFNPWSDRNYCTYEPRWPKFEPQINTKLNLTLEVGILPDSKASEGSLFPRLSVGEVIVDHIIPNLPNFHSQWDAKRETESRFNKWIKEHAQPGLNAYARAIEEKSPARLSLFPLSRMLTPDYPIGSYFNQYDKVVHFVRGDLRLEGTMDS